MAAKIVETIKLHTAKNGAIKVAHIDHPYGKFSSPIISIGVLLSNSETKNPEWKIHVPYENLHNLIKALQKAENVHYEADIWYRPNDEFVAPTGDGLIFIN